MVDKEKVIICSKQAKYLLSLRSYSSNSLRDLPIEMSLASICREQSRKIKCGPQDTDPRLCLDYKDKTEDQNKQMKVPLMEWKWLAVGLVWKGQLDLALDKPEDYLKLDTTDEGKRSRMWASLMGLLVQPQWEQKSGNPRMETGNEGSSKGSEEIVLAGLEDMVKLQKGLAQDFST
ncbi:hypothetical protein HJG60_008222 [Phyllostomus discolor]|uniref:Uncharacterized protein n=1 Tax=Phyllostomus discolor TaxID=89673 RepID=A0A833ZCD3_9CHIR|nr:hypothetical protein HJG60_008222 [Phyllostomus discolor]